jgi:hypothetical protein
MEFIFSLSDVMYFLFFNEETQYSFRVVLIKAIFSFNPSFLLTQMYSSIVKIAATHQNSNNFGWDKGVPYEWHYFVERKQGTFITGEKYNIPSPMFFWCVSLIFTIIYLTFAWYFDHIVGSNRGVAE